MRRHGTASNETTISHDFEQTICPGSENERTTGKTASHSVGIPASCPEGSTSNPTEYTQDDPESGSGVSSGSQSGSGGCSGPNCGGGSYTYTLIAPETCNYPVGNRPTPGDSGNGGNEPNPDPDDNGCGSDKGDNTCKQCEPNKKKSSSDVILTSGTYSFNAVDLHVPARGLEVELKRFYRSNRVLPVSGGIIFGEPIDGPFGYGWTTPYTVKIVDGDTFIDAAGRYFKFEKDSAGRFLTDTQSGQRLEKTSSGYTLTKLDTFTRSFDNDGKLLSKSDNFGNTLTMHYDGGGRLSEVADASGRIALTFTYNSDDRVEMVTDLAGRQVLYEYDGFGNLTGVTDAMDETYSYVYNSYHGLTAKTNPLDQTVWVQYQYADKGVAGKVIDAIGVDNLNRGEEVGEHEQRFVYDFSGGIVYITEKDGRQLKRLINNNGKLTSETEIDSDKTLKKVEYLDNRTEKITDLAGTVVIKKKDEWGNLLRKVDGEGNAWIYTYTSGNRLSSKTAPDGTISRYEYNSQKRVSKKIHAAGTAVEQVTSYEYDQSGQLKAISVNGLTTTYDYNDAGQRIAVTNPAGETQSFEYDGYGYLSAAIDAEGHRSEFSYDKLGHLLEKRTLLDGKTLTTSFTYDALGHLTQQIDPLGHATSYEHDLKGRVTAITDPLLNRSEYVYDGKGNLVQMTQIAPGTDRSRDSVTTMEYDEQSRLIKTIDPEGNSTRYSYSDTVSGCSSCGGSTHTPETITDPFGQVTHNQFDKNGRLIALQTPLDQINNTINTQVYNNVGQVISRTDSNGNTTHYQHNALGQITAQIDANLGQTLYGYDSTGRLKSLTDPEGNTTTFEYDAAGRKSKEIRPLGETTQLPLLSQRPAQKCQRPQRADHNLHLRSGQSSHPDQLRR
ncbi:DUF6531 domain-containing protein [uncultured Desulfuromusa sp.]|uniref:DUF6531 domain-containing protein n=1 Tax=uncultured Desulfuromusa sp. TaxID=219183 RepID=UPI002AA8D469|nr:DUF6531 domain-containing protein [uncultured Desulfuromusa sp.]